MTITLEQIDRVIERTHTDYQTAKKALEAHNGDVVEAIVSIENKTSQSDDIYENADAWKGKITWFLKQVCKAIEYTLNIKVIWRKKETQYLEVPLLVVILFTLWLMPLSLIVLAAPFFFGIRVYIKGAFGKTRDLAEWVQKS